MCVKQKTAYEMRISDWSSDVCSSDLFVSGDGLDDALEALVPADVRGVKPFAQKYSLLLAENGGILDDLMITRWEDGLYMVVNGAVKYDDIGHLRDHLPDAITLKDRKSTRLNSSH